MARKKASSKTISIEDELKEIKEQQKNLLNFKINFKCKNKKQKDLVNSIYENDITLCSAFAGTGKSICSQYAALQLLKDPDKGFEKIIIVVPVELDDSENLGWLSGGLDDKLSVYTEASKSNLEKIFNASGKNGKEFVNKLIEAGIIEYRPTSYLRGCSIDSSIIIIDESQNLGVSVFLKVLTRIGTNTKLVFIGDRYQIDSASIKKKRQESGLMYAIEHLGNLPKVGVIKFQLKDIIRNDIIKDILKSWSPEIYKAIEDEETEDLKNADDLENDIS